MHPALPFAIIAMVAQVVPLFINGYDKRNRR